MDYKLLHEPFFDSVKKFEQKTAVINDKIQLTYRQLDHFSDILSESILSINKQNSKIIGILLEKGWEQIVSTLAILKSGFTYLPISIDNPASRVHKILSIAKVNLVISKRKYLPCLPSDIQTIIFDELDFYEEKKVTIRNLNQAEKLAYVIFTSGTTDEPKGVMIEHKAALNTILDINKRFNVNENDVILSLSELSFDLSVYDIFGAFAAGATIVIPRNLSKKFPHHWYNIVIQYHITIWNSVPTFMSMFMECVEKCPIDLDIRLALLSGDWIPLNLPLKIKEFIPNCLTVSLGGATEASIWSIIYIIDKVDKRWRSIPYGKPLSNQNVFVMNEEMSICKSNETGEICIEGAGLASGYLNNPQLTDRSFIIHPHTHKRIYKTGDLGRYLSDGNIEILGRIDFQVKINGYRIELKEIEYILLKHPDILDAIIDAWGKDHLSQKTLIGYIKLKANSCLCDEEIKEFLKNKIPGYMIPHHYIYIDEIPLSSNGKIDRKCLEIPAKLLDR